MATKSEFLTSILTRSCLFPNLFLILFETPIPKLCTIFTQINTDSTPRSTAVNQDVTMTCGNEPAKHQRCNIASAVQVALRTAE